MLSDEIQSAILARPDLKPKRKAERVFFRCPRHEDDSPSAWTGGGAWGCFACGFQEPIQSLAEEIGVGLKGDGNYSLAEYADSKALPLPKLRSWGLTEETVKDRTVVRIPYYDEEGKELRARFRSRTGKWWEGRNKPIYLYGIDQLVDAKEGDRVLVVEGESDCHACWSDGILAVGVPGATAWKSEWADYLKGLDVYLWEEPDQGGSEFVSRITKDIPNAKIIEASGAKDPADLRVRTNGKMQSRLAEMMAAAVPANVGKPPAAFDLLLTDRLGRLLEEKKKPIEAVPTPFPSWNKVCGDQGGGEGLAKGWHIICAARTGAGKSILALQLAVQAMKAGERVCLVSLEMHQHQAETRLLAVLSGRPVRELEMGRGFSEATYREAASEVERIHHDYGGVFITNREILRNVDDVEQAIRYNHEVHGCRYFITDYLQLAGNANDPESITEVSHRVRHLAVETGSVSVGLSQFNRSTSSLNERPTPQGLMGGSALENDAEQVVLIDHSAVEPVTELLPGGGMLEGWKTTLMVAKNRHGSCTDIPFMFNKKNLQMRETLPDE